MKRESTNVWTVSEITGTFVASLCCFTPLAVLGLSAGGLGYMTGYIDYFALPVFAISIGMIGYGLFRKSCYRKPQG
ncbi:MAG: mercury resistance system transport protein MerF [Nitrospirales bacterium]